jgi:hypothetical protein
VITKNPEPKLDHNGVQRPDKQTGDPIWSTQVVVTRLVAIPWATNGRSGIAYRADRIKAL